MQSIAVYVERLKPRNGQRRGLKMETKQDGFQRVIGVRQMRLLALGSTIGVGLFLGSASAIKLAVISPHWVDLVEC
jgi:amino acid permease